MAKAGIFEDQGKRKFGAFLGVFTPSVMTILGVIMYLRFGWVVANAGLMGSVIIVLICSGIAFITSVSISAVATNSPIGAGGEYFMISRSLGLTIGGAIGIPLFLCYTLSITLYCYGLAEALSIFWPATWGDPPLQYAASLMIILIVIVAGKSANLALKLQLPLMLLVGLSILALVIGVLRGPFQAPQWRPSEGLAESGGLWAVLAVFFPAVTGFSAGIGMSGDLKDPQKAIPRGTMAAVSVGTIVYLTIPFLLSITTVNHDGLADPLVWTKIALLGPILVFPGIWGAILSSAFGSALAGPRILQALAQDGLAPRFLGRLSKTGEPAIATWVGGAIALSAVAMGSLNTVAKMVTILFLTLYMIENLVAAVENLVKDPSYRPTLRVHWSISLAGAIGIMVVMFLISPQATVLAVILEASLYLYLRKKQLVAAWGNVWAGLWGSLARFSLNKLTHQVVVPRSWRPNILLFADQLEKRTGQVRMSAWFNQNRGILTVCDVITEQVAEGIESAGELEAKMLRFFDNEGIVAFSEVDFMEDFESGALSIVQAHGIGSLRANTIAFGWPWRPEKLVSLLKIIREVAQVEKASYIVRCKPPQGPVGYDRIDIWWRGKFNNGDLMLLLAYLLTMNAVWRNATIYLRSIVTKDMTRVDIEESLSSLIESVRIKAKLDVMVLEEGKSVTEMMHETSKDADVVFMGLMPPEVGKESEYAQRLIELLEPLPTTILVHNSGPFRGKLL